jgi:hypothetical protein
LDVQAPPWQLSHAPQAAQQLVEAMHFLPHFFVPRLHFFFFFFFFLASVCSALVTLPIPMTPSTPRLRRRVRWGLSRVARASNWSESMVASSQVTRKPEHHGSEKTSEGHP